METKQKLSDAEKFCLDAYISNGNRTLTYTLSHPCNTTNENSIKSMVKRFFTRPDVKQYIEERRQVLMVSAIKDRAAHPGKNRTKADVVTELNALLDAETNSKVKADLMKLLTSLEHMNEQASTTEDNKQVQLYLPLRCFDCEYKKIYDEQHPKEDER